MPFSKKFGYQSADHPITVREDAPADFRYAVAAIARECGMQPSRIRDIACLTLRVKPDRNNWSEYPNIWDEVLALLESCDWFKVYDIAEAIWRDFETRYDETQDRFEAELNEVLRDKGIGWELKDPQGIVYRGEEAFGSATTRAVEVLEQTGRARAASEVREALTDISRRPIADVTGAMHHALAALEAVARDVAGDPKATLGAVVSKLALPAPLDTVVSKLWGFASERARHVREGDTIDYPSAEFTVSAACAVATYLATR